MHTAEPHRRQIICQLPADPRGLTLQLHSLLDMGAACFGLMGAPPE